MTHAIPFFAAILFAAASLDASEPAKEKDNSPAAIRAKYLKASADILKIAEPIQSVEVFYWKDGGSIGIVLKDAKKKDHAFALDGRMKGARDLYVGANYPGGKGSRIVEFRGPEESALYAVLLRWVENHKHRKQIYDDNADLNRAEFGNLWEFRAFFFRLDQRFTK